ncbi:MAG TPA: hypothetical protein VGC76_15315 [Pyrinomonadaceae bacterium]
MKKEDYLWDKTGSDPEIERLENALAVFRYKETAPPELPAKVLPFTKKENTRSFFRFAYAAACVAFVAIALGVWFQISNKKPVVAEIRTEFAAPVIENKIADVVPVKDTEQSNVAAPKQFINRKAVKIQKAVYKNNLAAREIKVKSATVALSKEEKYAYDQLMLALSITSSKLKLVSDKIEGNTVNNDGR